MSDVIRLLPDSVANLIAAGEVIQRPASVVKELVENSVDAGADNIQIIIKDAGRTLIQVIDNGRGMTPTDARMAFERHATSKIKEANDLFSLHTMGFRGEALATIAAVAEVDLRTMPHGESIGSKIIINDNKVESQEPEACVPGSNMMVKNLFSRQPARRKFLKKDSVELSHIIHEFERLALVNLDIEFTLMHNGAVLHKLPKSPMKQRISDLFGKSVGQQLIPVETETSIVKINGFVGLPENARRRNALQYFFVNGRNMRHPYFHRAVMQCYEQLIPSECHPTYFLNFTVNPQAIDVNIHPTKNEIKFEDEQAIWQILAAAVKESLGKFNAVPAIDFDSVDAPEIPAFTPDTTANPSFKLDPTYNPFNQPYTSPTGGTSGSAMNSWSRERRAVTDDWDKLYQRFEGNKEELSMPATETRESALNSDFPPSDSLDLGTQKSNIGVMQLRNKYIITPTHGGLMVVDQHRAHERILYERFLNMIESGAFSSQRLIFPEAIDLTPSQHVMLESIAPQLSELGWDISCLGPNSWAINGQPAVIGDRNPVEILLAILADFIETGQPIADEIVSRTAQSLASAASIQPGQPLSIEEMDRLLSDLFKLSSPGYTADGRTVLSVITYDDINKLFV